MIYVKTGKEEAVISINQQIFKCFAELTVAETV
jgi:hypothetical protein